MRKKSLNSRDGRIAADSSVKNSNRTIEDWQLLFEGHAETPRQVRARAMVDDAAAALMIFSSILARDRYLQVRKSGPLRRFRD